MTSQSINASELNLQQLDRIKSQLEDVSSWSFFYLMPTTKQQYITGATDVDFFHETAEDGSGSIHRFQRVTASYDT